MKNIINFLLSICSIRIVKFAFIPLGLIAFWILSSILFVYPPTFSVISKYQDISSTDNFSTDKILKGDKIRGTVTATENNLGILLIRFNPSAPVEYKDEDILLFSMKEKGSDKRLVENTYRSGIVDKSPFLPIGFPRIEDSKGKIYEFQIESLNGNQENAMTLSGSKPTMALQYKFTKSEILKDSRAFFDFTLLKIQTFLTDRQSLVLSFPYILPLFFYYVSLITRNIHFSRFVLFYLVLSFVFIDVFVDYYAFDHIGDIFLLFFLVLSILKYRLGSSIIFSLSGLLFIISILAIILNKELITQKSSDWVYYLMAIGVAQVVWEVKSENRIITVREIIRKTLSKYES